MINSLDARDRPPESIKRVYKKYQKRTPEAIQSDPNVIDFRQGLSDEQQGNVLKVGSVLPSSIDAACSHLDSTDAHEDVASSMSLPVYETEAVPGKP